jgi:hypothetical protein
MRFKSIFDLVIASAFAGSHAANITDRVVAVADGDTVC